MRSLCSSEDPAQPIKHRMKLFKNMSFKEQKNQGQAPPRTQRGRGSDLRVAEAPAQQAWLGSSPIHLPGAEEEEGLLPSVGLGLRPPSWKLSPSLHFCFGSPSTSLESITGVPDALFSPSFPAAKGPLHPSAPACVQAPLGHAWGGKLKFYD